MPKKLTLYLSEYEAREVASELRDRAFYAEEERISPSMPAVFRKLALAIDNLFDRDTEITIKRKPID